MPITDQDQREANLAEKRALNVDIVEEEEVVVVEAPTPSRDSPNIQIDYILKRIEAYVCVYLDYYDNSPHRNKASIRLLLLFFENSSVIRFPLHKLSTFNWEYPTVLKKSILRTR